MGISRGACSLIVVDIDGGASVDRVGEERSKRQPTGEQSARCELIRGVADDDCAMQAQSQSERQLRYRTQSLTVVAPRSGQQPQGSSPPQ